MKSDKYTDEYISELKGEIKSLKEQLEAATSNHVSGRSATIFASLSAIPAIIGAALCGLGWSAQSAREHMLVGLGIGLTSVCGVFMIATGIAALSLPWRNGCKSCEGLKAQLAHAKLEETKLIEALSGEGKS